MRLSALDSKNLDIDVLLLQTPSTQLTIFLQDKIKRRFKCNSDSIISIDTKSDIKKIREVNGVFPPFASRWYVYVNLDTFYDKTLVQYIMESTTCVFFCTCSKYATFKKFKSDLKGHSGVVDFYINYLRKPDFVYLYDAFTSKNKLSKPLFDYVVKSYSGDIDALFELLIRLSQGEKFESRKAITDACGLGSLSIESYILDLLRELSGSDKGLKKVIRNKVKSGTDLGSSIGFSSMYNFMAKSLLCFCEIKMLMLSGVVYKTIRDLPSSFDEKSLARYQRYIWRLNEVPLSELLRLRKCLGDVVWKSELDFLNFIYRYYSMKAEIKCKGEIELCQ